MNVATAKETELICRVRYSGGTYVASADGKRATCTESAEAAAKALGRKLFGERFLYTNDKEDGRFGLIGLAADQEEAPATQPTQTMPTKEQWEKVKLELSFPNSSVEMEVDGIQVTWQVRLAKALKYVICPFIDGKHYYGLFAAEDLKAEPSEEVKRNQRLFCRKVEKRFLSEKELAPFKKFKTRAEFKAMQERNTFTQYNPLWASPTSLISHLKREAKTIVIKRIGYATL